jgi:phosphatidylserine/phosphatidylglycerophosphate/cardiolipin synthase-like enzyme
VDVRVILEGNVFGTPRINDATYKKLKNAHIPVVFSDSQKYNFTHAKFWMIDDTYCVSTGNLTYSAFQKNRDIIVCDTDKKVLSFFELLFLADERHMFPVFP